MEKTTGKDLTVGSIPTNILKFALPMMVGLFLSMGYSIVDTIWNGNLLGREAMGAASSVITGQNIGAGKIKRVKEVFKWGVTTICSMVYYLSGRYEKKYVELCEDEDISNI